MVEYTGCRKRIPEHEEHYHFDGTTWRLFKREWRQSYPHYCDAPVGDKNSNPKLCMRCMKQLGLLW